MLSLSCGPRLSRPTHHALPEARRQSPVEELPTGPGRVRELVGSCLPLSFEVCANALDDNCDGQVDEGCGLAMGLLQFVIAWPADGSDVDLHVQMPSGQLIEVGGDGSSGFTHERDCPGRNGECEGVNWELVASEGVVTPPRGEYRVTVRLESLPVEGQEVPVTLSAQILGRVRSFHLDFSRSEQQVVVPIQF